MDNKINQANEPTSVDHLVSTVAYAHQVRPTEEYPCALFKISTCEHACSNNLFRKSSPSDTRISFRTVQNQCAQASQFLWNKKHTTTHTASLFESSLLTRKLWSNCINASNEALRDIHRIPEPLFVTIFLSETLKAIEPFFFVETAICACRTPIFLECPIHLYVLGLRHWCL